MCHVVLYSWFAQRSSVKGSYGQSSSSESWLMRDCQIVQRFTGKASISSPSAVASGAGDEYCGSGSSEISVVDPCGLTLPAGSLGGINMMLHSGICVFFLFFFFLGSFSILPTDTSPTLNYTEDITLNSNSELGISSTGVAVQSCFAFFV